MWLANVCSVATCPGGPASLLRACLTIVAVAVISACLVHMRDAQGQRAASADATRIAWVRTIDGWEPSSVLQRRPRPLGPPSLHPGLVASLQLGVSLFALIALPTAKRTPRKS